MKYIIISMCLLVSLNADEMKRIESILNDIVELRSDFQECRAALEDKELAEEVRANDNIIMQKNNCIDAEEKLTVYKKLYNDEKAKNNILTTKLNIFSGSKPDSKDKKIRKYVKLLKIKQYEILQLKNQIKNINLVETKKTFKIVELDSKFNTFPKLKLKKQYEKHSDVNNIKILNHKKETIVNFKAATFRLNYDSIIYDGINGKKRYVWKKGRSFTSNIKTASLMKITGYFAKRKWIGAKEEMWIKASQISKK